MPRLEGKSPDGRAQSAHYVFKLDSCYKGQGHSSIPWFCRKYALKRNSHFPPLRQASHLCNGNLHSDFDDWLCNVADFLKRLFDFRAIVIGEPLHIHGGELRAWYTLHSIPALGIEASYAGKSIAISGDTMYSPEMFDKLHALGVISDGRRYVTQDSIYTASRPPSVGLLRGQQS